MRASRLAASVVFVALFGGCGGEDESAPSADKATALRIVAPNTGGGAFRYADDRLEVPAGRVELELVNEDVHQHDVKLQTGEKCCYEPGAKDVGGTDVIQQGTTKAVVDLEAGEYVFFCSVPGHAEDGMQGRLTAS
jgi:plastocyanin